MTWFCASALDRDHVVRPRLLPFVESLRLGTIAQCEMRGFHECPGHVLVTVLGVPRALLPAVAVMPTIDAARQYETSSSRIVGRKRSCVLPFFKVLS